MTDIAFASLLDYQQPSYSDGDDAHHDFSWSGITLLDPHSNTLTHTSYPDEIEYIYTGLHKCVDQAVAKISVCTPARLDQIREQNRKLIDKLTTLESTITGDTTAAVTVLGSHVRSSASAPTRIEQTRRGGKRRRVLASPTSPGNSTSSPPSSETQRGNNTPPDQANVNGGSLITGAEGGDSKLVKKLLQVGNQDARTRVAEFAVQLHKAPEDKNALPNICQYANVSQITDVSHFLRLVLDLGLAIETNTFGEQNSRIKKRIALAHFYHAYTLAQDNPGIFLSWCDDHRVHGGSMLPKGGSKSVVQHRFADLIFSPAETRGRIPGKRGMESSEDTKRRIAKIQMWRKSGKRWAQFIQRFGYGILLLLPCSLSDEDLRITHDKVILAGLDLVESRRHLFHDVLQQANNLLDTHFFPPDVNIHLNSACSPSQLARADWDDLLNSSALGT